MRPLIRECLIWYYSAALRQISPMHPDVPAIVLRLNRLMCERHGRTIGKKAAVSPDKPCASSY